MSPLKLLAVSPPTGTGSAYLPAPETPVGMCSTVIAGLGNSCLSNMTFFLWIGQMQVSSQDSSFPWLCSYNSADCKGRTGPLSSSPSEGLAGAGHRALVAAILAPALQTLPCPQPGCDSSVCQQTPAPSGSTQFSMGSCRDNPCSLWLGWEQARTMNCCEVNMGMGNIVQQAADPQHTHSCSSYTHSTDTLLSNLFPISCSRESDPQRLSRPWRTHCLWCP